MSTLPVSNFEAPELWELTGEIVRVQNKGKPDTQWLAQVWRERLSGRVDYRPLRLVELSEKDNASIRRL